MNINEIKEMIYNATVDGHLKPLWAVDKYVEKLQKLDEEILMLVYNKDWNKAMGEVDQGLSPWEQS